MKLIWMVLALLLWPAIAHAQRACDRIAPFKHINATGPIELVPAVPGQRVYYCGFTILQKGNTLDLIITVGQGTNCGMNTVQFTPQMELPNDFALSSRTETVGPYTEPGFALCIQTIGSNAKLGGMIFYAQF
jgi:hypothetical protein